MVQVQRQEAAAQPLQRRAHAARSEVHVRDPEVRQVSGDVDIVASECKMNFGSRT